MHMRKLFKEIEMKANKIIDLETKLNKLMNYNMEREYSEITEND